MWIKSKIQKSNQLPHQNANYICDSSEQNMVLNKILQSIDNMTQKDEKPPVTRKSIWYVTKKRIVKDIFQPHEEILRTDLGNSHQILYDYKSIAQVHRGKKIQTLQIPRLKDTDSNNTRHTYNGFNSNKNEWCATLKDRCGENFCFVLFCFCSLIEKNKFKHLPT